MKTDGHACWSESQARRSFIPPSGKHDPTCEFLCTNVRTTCVHACSVCDEKFEQHSKENAR